MGTLTEEQKSSIARRMIAGESQTKLAKEFGITVSGIRGIAQRRGYTGKRTARRIPVDETSFERITPASAYWAGFLIADGCVSDAGLLQVRLSIKDLSHLEKFRAFIKSGHKIHHQMQGAPGTDEKFGAVHFAVFSKKLVNDLKKFGVVPRKSLTKKAGVCVIDNPHFWRGVIDGDGSIGIWSNRNLPCISLSGSRQITTQFIQYARRIHVQNNYKGRPYVTTPHTDRSKAFYVKANGWLAISVAKILYIDAHPECRLERKFDSAMDMITHNYGRSSVQ